MRTTDSKNLPAGGLRLTPLRVSSELSSRPLNPVTAGSLPAAECIDGRIFRVCGLYVLLNQSTDYVGVTMNIPANWSREVSRSLIS